MWATRPEIDMEPNASPQVEFHEQAAERFSQLAQDLLSRVRTFGGVERPHPQNSEIHPVATITEQDVKDVTIQESLVNLVGEEGGRFWESGGYRVGWQGADFEAIKQLASKLENSTPLKGRVSTSFVLAEVFAWLRGTLEKKRTESLTDYIGARCTAEIKDYELWIPVYRTYSARDFSIGDVQFRKISAPILDRWYEHIPESARKPEVVATLNRERSMLQGTLAACIKVRAEFEKAKETAHAAADEAIALLRFLSPVNWTCRIVSHCLPMGRENTRTTVTLVINNGEIGSLNKATVEEGPAGWNIDEARQTSLTTGALEKLHKLALHRTDTDFRADVYGALQLHARHSVATEIAHKIVFVVAAAESLLLRDSSEPIQKNLGERMAFLIGSTLTERKAIVKNVDHFYQIRSGLIHHGREVQPEERDVIDTFFLSVWLSFARLLTYVDQFQSRKDMFEMLEDLKLS